MKKLRYFIKFKNENVENAIKQSGGFNRLFISIESAIAFATNEGFNLKDIKVVRIDMIDCTPN